jgi:hypothetical protein
MKLLAEIREALIEHILRKRLQKRYDKGFLAGIDTAENAVIVGAGGNAICEVAIRQAREGYLEEVASR